MTSPHSLRRLAAGPLALIVAAMLTVAGCGSTADAGGAGPSNSGDGGTEVVRVPEDAATITDALASVSPGGLVLVGPGTYPEEVTVDVEDVTLRGTDRNEVIIDGGGVRSFGIVATADGVRIENLTVHSALFYGVLVTSMHDESGPLAHGGPGYTPWDPADFPPLERFAVDHVTAYNNGLYGIYAFNALDGVITNSYASGSADSGIYVGQCEQCGILVQGNVAERNAIGFENANASDSVVIAGNRFSGNRVGMTLISNYQEAFTPQRGNLVVGNLIADNTSADSPAHALGAFGVGVGIDGGQENQLVNNRITGNPVAGVQLTNAEDIAAAGNEITGGEISGNGVDLLDISAQRAPSERTCLTDVTFETAEPAGLGEAVCPAGYGGAGGQQVPEVAVPDGISFLQVPAPSDQPSLSLGDELPPPLPDQVDLPDAAAFPVPDAELLADRSGTA